MTMDNKSCEAKRLMLNEFRLCCRNNNTEMNLINEFAKIYHPDDAIKWYTRPCFLYRILNKALRTEDVRALYIFRYFIIDMCKGLEKLSKDTIRKHTASFRVYRGSKLSRSEVEQLHIGTLVSTKGFLSSSRNLEIAQVFIGLDPITRMSASRSRQEERQFVLFEIDVNLIDSPDIIVADVSNESSIEGENEIVFSLGTTFIVTRIHYDFQHYLWNIRMVTSSEMSVLIRDYVDFIQQRLEETHPTVLFGQYLCDVSGDYSGAVNYFHRVLRSIPVHDEIHPNLYHQLGRAYCYLGKYQQAIMSFRIALLLQRRRLPQMNFHYAHTLSGLALTFSDMGDSIQAMKLQTQAITLLRNILARDHVEIALNSIKLAYIYWQEKKYESAQVLLSNALPIFKQKLPYGYADYAQALHTMALVERTLGNRKKAIECFEKALHMRKLFLATDHLSVARTYFELSMTYIEQEEEYSIARDYAQRALTIYEIRLPLNHNERQKALKLVQQLLSKETAVTGDY